MLPAQVVYAFSVVLSALAAFDKHGCLSALLAAFDNYECLSALAALGTYGCLSALAFKMLPPVCCPLL